MTSILTPQKLRLAYTTSDPTPSNGDVWYRGDLQALLAYLGGVKYISTERTPEVVVAASDAPDLVKRHADYVCDGSADEEEINDAISSVSTKGGVVRLSPGTFYVSSNASITMANNVYVKGSGQGATYIDASGRTPDGPPVINNIGYDGGIGSLRMANPVDSAIIHVEGSAYFSIFDFGAYESKNYKPLEIVEDENGKYPNIFLSNSRIEGELSEIKGATLNIVNNKFKIQNRLHIVPEITVGSVIVGNRFYNGQVEIYGGYVTIVGNDFEINRIIFRCENAAISGNKIGDERATILIDFSGDKQTVVGNEIEISKGYSIKISGHDGVFSGNTIAGSVEITGSHITFSSNKVGDITVEGDYIMINSNLTTTITLEPGSSDCCVVGNKGSVVDNGTDNYLCCNCPG